MRRAYIAVLLASCACLLAPAGAAADGMDITLARLRLRTGPGGPGDCAATVGENGLPRAFCADAQAWQALMSELGGSMIPIVISPARTVGYGGFYVGLEGWVTGIDGGARHWRYGTEGDSRAGSETCDPADDTGLGCNRFASDALVWSRVSARKGFPFGFELGTQFQYLLGTDVWAWGLEIKWAILEGYRTGILGILPDVAVRGMVNTLVGDPEFNLTVPSIDVILSKPIAVMGAGTITPFVSGQLAWVFADSELVDLTPEIDAFSECEPRTDSSTTICRPTDPDRDPVPGGRMPGEDYNNNATFPQLRATRTRLAFGVQGRYEALTLTASFGFDLQEAPKADADLEDLDLRRQWQAAAGVGLTF